MNADFAVFAVTGQSAVLAVLVFVAGTGALFMYDTEVSHLVNPGRMKYQAVVCMKW